MYLNLVQIAQSFGVSEKVVEDWIRNEKLPHIPDRGRLLFDRAQVADWATTRGLAAQAGFLAPANPAVAGGWKLEPLLRAGGIWRDVAPAQLTSVLARVVAALPGATPPVRQLLAQRLQAPGGITIAPVGGGLALPHLSKHVALGRDSGTVALVLLKEELPLPEPPPDGVPVTRLLFFLAPSPRAHLDLLGRLSRTLARGPLRELVMRGAPDEEILKTVAAGDVSAPSEPGREVKA
jgi:PTS system nitrogen regulatory IIA component